MAALMEAHWGANDAAPRSLPRSILIGGKAQDRIVHNTVPVRMNIKVVLGQITS